MIRPARPRPWVYPLLLLIGATARGDDSANLDRLRDLPPERRARLAASLAEFDKLPDSKKAAIRDFDSKIADLPDDEVRADYLDVLRRYSLWRRTLTDDDRKRLDDAPPERRVRLVNELRKAQAEKLKNDLASRPDWIQFSSLNDLTLFWTALHLKIWFVLTDDQKAEVTRLDQRDQRIIRLQALGKKQKVLDKFAHLKQEFLDEIAKAEGLREDKRLGQAKQRLEKAEKKRLPPSNPNPDTRKAEMNYLKEHRPARVDQAHLKQFEEECPAWLRESLEPLPPDAARRRLILLYRMIFPPPEEIPPPKPRPPASKAGPRDPATP